MAAAKAIASIIPDDELVNDYIVPKPYDARIVPLVARSVAVAAIESGVARLDISPDEVETNARLMSPLM